MRLFFGEARCAVCHKGPTLSDDRFHNIGTAAPTDLGAAPFLARLDAGLAGDEPAAPRRSPSTGSQARIPGLPAR